MWTKESWRIAGLHRAALVREVAGRLGVRRLANLVEVWPDNAILNCGREEIEARFTRLLTRSTALPSRRPAAVPVPSVPLAELDVASQASSAVHRDRTDVRRPVRAEDGAPVLPL